MGALLVVVSERGVRAVSIADDEATLRDDLVSMFPNDLCNEDVDALSDVVNDVRVSIDEGHAYDHDLDIVGTDFQRRVWKALLDIPHGTTCTYTELATRVHAAHAVRAVASACGANTIAVIVPCHRVVRADGGLADYRWGIERKRILLERESSALTLF